MGIGFETFDDANRLQVSGSFASYILKASGSGNTISRIGGNTNPSSAVVPMAGYSTQRFVAFQGKGFSMAPCGQTNYQGAAHYHFVCDAAVGTSFNYYIFEPATNLTTTNNGIEILDANGNIVFQTGRYNMQCVAMMSYGEGTEGSAWYNYYAMDPDSVNRPGRQLAVAVGSVGAHRIAGGMMCYDGGQAVIPRDQDFQCNDYRYQNNMKLYGATISANGDTATTAAVSYDDVLVSNGSSNTAPPDFVIPAKMFVIDVTGIVPGSVYVPPTGTKTATMSGGNESFTYTDNFKYFPTRALTATGGTPTNYNWYFTDTSGGSWSVYSGQNTTQAVPLVTGVNPQVTAACNFWCTVTFSDGSTANTGNKTLYYQNTTAATVAQGTVTIAGGATTLSAASASQTFSTFTANSTGATPTSNTWSYQSSSGGTWSLSTTSGGSTVPSVTGVPNGGTAYGLLRVDTNYTTGNPDAESVQLQYTNTTLNPVAAGLTPGPGAYAYTDPNGYLTEQVVGVSGGTPSSYAWQMINQSGGSWGFYAGGGSTSDRASPYAFGVAAGTTAYATIYVTVTFTTGQTAAASANLSYQNTTAVQSGVTFSPVAGSYYADDGGAANPVSYSITASQAVTWTWTRTGATGTASIASGGSGTTITFSITNGITAKSTTWSVTASGAGSGSWSIQLANTGTGNCVTTDTVLPSFARADMVQVGDYLDIADPVSFAMRKGLVSRADVVQQPCVRITTLSGIVLECSDTAPIAVEGGELVVAAGLIGYSVPVCDQGVWGHDTVAMVDDIGLKDVVHITCENDLFLAGQTEGRYLLHHNIKS